MVPPLVGRLPTLDAPPALDNTAAGPHLVGLDKSWRAGTGNSLSQPPIPSPSPPPHRSPHAPPLTSAARPGATALPHHRTTALPLDRTTARPLDRSTARTNMPRRGPGNGPPRTPSDGLTHHLVPLHPGRRRANPPSRGLTHPMGAATRSPSLPCRDGGGRHASPTVSVSCKNSAPGLDATGLLDRGGAVDDQNLAVDVGVVEQEHPDHRDDVVGFGQLTGRGTADDLVELGLAEDG